MPQLGPEYDLATRLTRLERLVQQLAGNQLGQAFSATQSDGSVGMSITQNQSGAGATALQFYYGPNTARDANTGLHPLLLYIGQLMQNGLPINNGVVLQRSNGRQIASFGDGGPALRDAAGGLIFGSDETSGQGLARPWIPLPTPMGWGTATWPSTSSTSDAIISVSACYVQQPKIRWYALATAPPGTNGQLHIQTASGATVGATQAVTGGAFTTIDETLALNAADYVFGADTHLEVHGNVTAGTGALSVQVFGLYGRQS